MKNILLLTTFEADTLQSLKIAADVISNSSSEVYLLSVSEISDSITDLLFLSQSDHVDVEKKTELLNQLQNFKEEHGFRFKVHVDHRYGLSRPILEQILERCNADLVIVPTSFQKSKQHIHQFALKLLHKTSCPLMFLPPKTEVLEEIKRALYLNGEGGLLTSAIENLPFHIIHQTMLEDANKYTIEELIERFEIDLVVKGKRNGKALHADEIEINKLGVPVLTV